MADQTTAPLLDVEGVEFSYGRLQVLFGIDLQVGPSEAVALLGTNGAGKSTLLRLISGLDRPSAGTIRFEGRDITGQPAERLTANGIVLVSGGRSVFADLTVAENLDVQTYTIRKRADVDDRRDAVLATFPRLKERLRQTAGALSGGEQQQLALAKALMLEPRLLCIDELSLGLAPIIVGQLLEIVRSIHALGVALLVVEQSLNIAANLCARAVFLEKGAVRFDGVTSDLLANDQIARAVFLGG